MESRVSQLAVMVMFAAQMPMPRRPLGIGYQTSTSENRGCKRMDSSQIHLGSYPAATSIAPVLFQAGIQWEPAVCITDCLERHFRDAKVGITDLLLLCFPQCGTRTALGLS
jgi:hypothetical protein